MRSTQRGLDVVRPLLARDGCRRTQPGDRIRGHAGSRSEPAWRRRALSLALCALCLAMTDLAMATGMPDPQRRLALAVIGDSDSHAFQDRISFPEGGPTRGGAYRAGTFNWYEILARLRSDEIDTGAWGVYGTRGRIARLIALLGLPSRAPRKQDYRYNFAVSGAGCEDLMDGYREVPSLVALMDQDPAPWRTGVVVIRIGINSFGTQGSLQRLGRDPRDPQVAARIAGCERSLKAAVAAIHQRHPSVRIVLVGSFNDSNSAKHFDHAWTPTALANIDQALDAYDRSLLDMARADDRLAFFNDRAWYAARWGGRDARGRPAYRDLVLPGGIRISNTVGDSPTHATLEDGHDGVAWNAAWAQSMIVLLNARWGLGLTPITNDEIAALVKADVARGR